MCIRLQGKVDPARRNYATIFSEMLAHKEALLAANLSVTILGKGGGRKNKVLLQLPEELVDAGLLRHYASLPFQVTCLRGLPGWLPGCASGLAGWAARAACMCTCRACPACCPRPCLRGR